mmetsp:Transcript_29108/g.61852  ORF Transcript_29108/g.61852 Transcript_29108/m.61852 type:complete len:223 (+) Transcript_29108:1-669(+)
MLYTAHVGDSRVVLGSHQSSVSDAESWEARDLTVDHKPELPDEMDRIKKGGGCVEWDGANSYRVYVRGKIDGRGKRYPGLNMSRSLGDMTAFYSAGISAEPDVHAIQLCSEGRAPTKSSQITTKLSHPRSEASTAAGTDIMGHASLDSDSTIDPAMSKFVLLCSDGVWEFLSSQDAVKIVGSYPKTEATDAADRLARVAWDRWIHHYGGEVVDDITVLVIHL